MKRRVARALAVMLASLTAPVAAADQRLLPAWWQSVAGQTSLRAGVWSHDRDLTGAGAVPQGAAWARMAPVFGQALDGFAEGWLQVDSVDGTEAELREAWLRYTNGPFEARVGREILVWGRADRLNPTDVIGSRDFTVLTANDDDQRRGLFNARVAYGSGPWTLDAIWLPEFRPNIYPLQRSRTGVDIQPEQKPRERSQFALKLDHTGGSLDWSLSAFQGINRDRDFVLTGLRLDGPAGPVVEVQQQYSPIRMLGADMAGTVGRFGYRAELAYTRVRGEATIYSKQDFAWLVAGADTTLASGWNINLQYSLRVIRHFSERSALANPAERAVALQSAAVNNQLDRVQNGMSLRLARRWMNELLELEVVTLGYLETGDSAFRPKLSYAFSDTLRGSIGADLFRGPELSYFGRVKDLSAVWVQLTYGY